MPENNFVVGMVKGYVMGLLRDWSAQDIYELMTNGNPIIDLLDLDVLSSLPSELSGIQEIIKKNRDKIYPYLTVEKIIELAWENKRPDLAQLLTMPDAARWMEKFLKLIKFVIDNIELDPPQIKYKIKEIIRKKKQTILPPPPPPIPPSNIENVTPPPTKPMNNNNKSRIQPIIPPPRSPPTPQPNPINNSNQSQQNPDLVYRKEKEDTEDDYEVGFQDL